MRVYLKASKRMYQGLVIRYHLRSFTSDRICIFRGTYLGTTQGLVTDFKKCFGSILCDTTRTCGEGKTLVYVVCFTPCHCTASSFFWRSYCSKITKQLSSYWINS